MYQTAEDLPDVDRHEIYAHHEEKDEWVQLPYRNSLWIENGSAVGDVSASEDFYNVIQYGDIIESVGLALDSYTDTLTPKGHIILSEPGHKLSGYIGFEGIDAEPEAGDVIDVGLKIRAGHTGFHGLKYDVGAERQVCSNGMMAFVSDLHFEQTHSDPFNPGLAQQAVDAVVEGTDDVEDRLRRAREETFQHEDEALLVLTDVGIDQYFDEPYDVLRDALRAEVANREQPTLYDTYNAATRALTHATDEDMPAYVRDEGLAQAGNLLDYPGYGSPDADYLGKRAVDNRINERIEADEDLEPVIAADADTERDRLFDLRAAYSEDR